MKPVRILTIWGIFLRFTERKVRSHWPSLAKWVWQIHLLIEKNEKKHDAMIAVIHEMSNLSACKLCAQRYVNIVCSCLTLSPSHLPFFSVDQKDKQTSSKCRIHRYLPTKKKRKQNKIRCWHEKLEQKV